MFAIVKPGTTITIYFAGTEDTRNIAWSKREDGATRFESRKAAKAAMDLLGGGCTVRPIKEN